MQHPDFLAALVRHASGGNPASNSVSPGEILPSAVINADEEAPPSPRVPSAASPESNASVNEVEDADGMRKEQWVVGRSGSPRGGTGGRGASGGGCSGQAQGRGGFEGCLPRSEEACA